MRDSTFGSFLWGVVVGGIIGAAVGMLVAPRPGDEMREQVGDFVGARRTAFDDAVSEGRAAAEQARAEMIAREAEALPGAEGAAP